MNEQNFTTTNLTQGQMGTQNKKKRARKMNKLRKRFDNSASIDPLSAYLLSRNTLEKRRQQIRKEEIRKEQEMLRQEHEAMMASKSIWFAKKKEKEEAIKNQRFERLRHNAVKRLRATNAPEEQFQMVQQKSAKQLAKQKRFERFKHNSIVRLRQTGAPQEQLQLLRQKTGKEFHQLRASLYKSYPNKKRQLKLSRETHEVNVLGGVEYKSSESNKARKKRNRPHPIGITNIYPMSKDQQEIVKRSIIEVIAMITEPGAGPRFTECKFMDGWIHVLCDDDYSRNWLVNLFENNHKPWPDAKLSILPPDKLPMAMDALVRVSRSYAESYDDFQKLLMTHNKGLDTSQWKLVQSVVLQKRLSFFVQLDVQSVKFLQDLNCKPSLGNTNVRFRLKNHFRRLQKNKKKELLAAANRPEVNVASTSSKIHDETASIKENDSEIDDLSDINTGSESLEEQRSSQNSQEAWGENIIPNEDNWGDELEIEGDLIDTDYSGEDWNEDTEEDESFPPEYGNRSEPCEKDNRNIQHNQNDKYSGEDWNEDTEEDESSPPEFGNRSEPYEEDYRNIQHNQNDQLEKQYSSNPQTTETRQSFRNDPENDRCQPPQNIRQYQSQRDTQRHLGERYQQKYSDRYPQSQYAYDRYSNVTFNRDSRTQETQDKYESMPSGSQGFWSTGPVRQEHINYRDTPEIPEKRNNIPLNTTYISRTTIECQNFKSEYIQLSQRSINLSQPNPNAFWRPPIFSQPNPNNSYWRQPTSIQPDPNNYSWTQQSLTRQLPETQRNSSVPFQNDLRVPQSTVVGNSRNIEDVRRYNGPPNWPRFSK